jgi:hypothetical protein
MLLSMHVSVPVPVVVVVVSNAHSSIGLVPSTTVASTAAFVLVGSRGLAAIMLVPMHVPVPVPVVVVVVSNAHSRIGFFAQFFVGLIHTLTICIREVR